MIIELEGLDGSGKSTQIDLLKQYFHNKNIKYKYIHFPNYDDKYSGQIIKLLLQGEFGNLKEIDPRLASFIFATDRLYMKNTIEKYIEEGNIVLLDRYFYSNILIQLTRVLDMDNIDNSKFFEWVYNLEFEKNKIPKPDIVLYLDVPFSFVKNNIIARKKENREYLEGKEDIYECDFSFQKKSIEVANFLCNKNYMTRVKCQENGKILSPETIHNNIIKNINDYFLKDPNIN